MKNKFSILCRLFINSCLKTKSDSKNYIRIKINHRKKIRPRFREVIKKIRSEFLEIKIELDLADQRGEDFPSLLKQYFPRMEKIMHFMLEEMNHLAHHFSDKEHLYHKDFFRDQLSAFLLTSPFSHRALMKPRGYAGDYQMIDMMCDENPFLGESSFGKMVQGATYHLKSGRAVDERNQYSSEQMNQIGSHVIHQERDFFLLNLACGSASDVQRFIRSSPAANRTQAYLVDQDEEALQMARERIGDSVEESKNKIKTHFYPMNVQKFLDDGQTLPKFDLIYSGGLFDYLNNMAFSFILVELFDRLNDGGFIVIGNFSSTDDSKIVRWYLSDWPLIYRTPEDLKRIASVLSKPKQIRVESNESGVILYLIIQK